MELVFPTCYGEGSRSADECFGPRRSLVQIRPLGIDETVPFPPGLIWSLSDLSSAFFERRFVHDSKPLLTSGWESILWRLAL